MENKKTFPTVLTHFFNLTTTATNPENLGTEVFNKTRQAATGSNFYSSKISTLLTDYQAVSAANSNRESEPAAQSQRSVKRAKRTGGASMWRRSRLPFLFKPLEIALQSAILSVTK